MSTIVSSPARPVVRVTLRGVATAEWIKLRSLRSAAWLLAGIVVSIVGIGVMPALGVAVGALPPDGGADPTGGALGGISAAQLSGRRARGSRRDQRVRLAHHRGDADRGAAPAAPGRGQGRRRRCGRVLRGPRRRAGRRARRCGAAGDGGCSGPRGRADARAARRGVGAVPHRHRRARGGVRVAPAQHRRRAGRAVRVPVPAVGARPGRCRRPCRTCRATPASRSCRSGPGLLPPWVGLRSTRRTPRPPWWPARSSSSVATRDADGIYTNATCPPRCRSAGKAARASPAFRTWGEVGPTHGAF